METVIVLTFNHLYNKIIPKETIIRKIERLSAKKSIENISYLLTNIHYEKFHDDLKSKYVYLKDIQLSQEAIKEINKKNQLLISPQTLLFLSKYISIYAKELTNDNGAVHIYDSEIRQIIDLQLMLADYMQIDIVDDVFRKYLMIKFNMKYNTKSLLSRTWYILKVIATSADTCKKYSDIFVDFNQKFLCEYGYSISDYLSTYFYLFNPFLNGHDFKGILIDPLRHFEKAKRSAICHKIVSELLCTVEKYREYSMKSIENTWDYEVLTEFPVLQINALYATVISEQHLQENIIENLIVKIEKLYNKNIFRQFLGHLFEPYVQKLGQSCVQNSSIGYSFKPEFEIKRNCKSSDAYIFRGKSVLVIEAKAKMLSRKKLFIDCNCKSIQDKIREQFIDPICQIDDRCEDIKRSAKYSHFFEGINEIYSVVVNFESCHLSVPEYHEFAMDGIYNYDMVGNSQLKTTEMKYFFSVGIEEFECICWLIEANHDVFKILKQYYPYSKNLFLYDYLKYAGIAYQVVPKFVDDNFRALRNEFHQFFF